MQTHMLLRSNYLKYRCLYSITVLLVIVIGIIIIISIVITVLIISSISIIIINIYFFSNLFCRASITMHTSISTSLRISCPSPKVNINLVLWSLTKYINAKPGIQWTEETIHELNEPPSDEERNSNRKENHTAICHSNIFLLWNYMYLTKNWKKKNISILCTLPSGHELLRDPTLENCIASLINQGSMGYSRHKSYLAILYTICTAKYPTE